MKKFLLCIVLPTILIVFAVVGSVELYLRSLPNDFKEKNQYLESHANNLKIMVLGASTVSMGIKPSYFDLQPAYNFAYASQSNDYNLWILSKCFDQMDSLKYVILDMSCGIPWCSGTTIAPGRNKFYRLYYGYPDLPVEFEVSASIREVCHRIWPSDGKEAVRTIDADGYQSGYYEDIPYDEQAWKESAEWSVDYYAKGLSNENAGVKYQGSVGCICKIIEKCQQKDIGVIMVTPPTMSMFYDNLDSKQMRILYGLVDSLKNEYDNVVYLDYFKADSLFSVDEMYNPTHLNPRGAKKFTLMLNDSINNMEVL